MLGAAEVPGWESAGQPILLSDPVLGTCDARWPPNYETKRISNWLATLIVRPDSVVLDLFSGGGRLAIAAARAGVRRVIAVEREAQYCELVRRRFETLVVE